VSDIDKDIRDQMDTWARSDRDDVAALAADRYDTALRGILAWARGLESTLPGSTAVGNIPAELRRIIAGSLGVSSQDTPPAPRPGECVRLYTPDDIITGVLYVGQDGKRRVLEHDRWGHLVDLPGRRVEPVRSDTDGDPR
jgi:hypothetical protein